VLKLATDENVDGRVIRGLLARMQDLDVVRVQDAGLSATDDRSILAWAAAEGRVLLTHDVRTMTRFAGERIKRGDPLTGVVILPRPGAVGAIIRALRDLIESHEPEELQDRILYLKL
jgi:predicted nuclease of predicted toxin-antitoxin system